jgi:hypothetical protein
MSLDGLELTGVLCPLLGGCDGLFGYSASDRQNQSLSQIRINDHGLLILTSL